MASAAVGTVGLVVGGEAVDFESFTVSRKTMFFGILLVTLQILDGYLTSVGVSRFGTEMEGNLVLRFLMEQIGSGLTLALVKVFAIGAVAALMSASRRLPWVSNALGGVACFYIVFAIIPWTYLLFIDVA